MPGPRRIHVRRVGWLIGNLAPLCGCGDRRSRGSESARACLAWLGSQPEPEQDWVKDGNEEHRVHLMQRHDAAAGHQNVYTRLLEPGHGQLAVPKSPILNSEANSSVKPVVPSPIKQDQVARDRRLELTGHILMASAGT